MSITPANRPHINRTIAAEYLRCARQLMDFEDRTEAVVVLAVRGYYLDSLGAAGRNDRGLYDDALVVLSGAACVAFNGNTDPTKYRRRMACLKPGAYRYKLGTHGLSKPAPQRYPAFVQAGPVTVIRDEVGPDTGMFGINIHRGSASTTSSLGCQTVPPAQWPAFYELVKAEMKRAATLTFCYVLIEESTFRSWVKGGKR